MKKKESSKSNQEGKLRKKLSNFGNGKTNLKIRQAISIGGSDSDHESIVMDNS